MLGITIRIGAAYDTLTTKDGAVFDRSRMSRSDNRKLTRLVREIYSNNTEGTING